MSINTIKSKIAGITDGGLNTAFEMRDVLTDITDTYSAATISDNTDEYVSGATFNTSDGVLTLGMQSGSTVTVDLDGRYSLTGHTHVIADITDFTDNSTNWNTKMKVAIVETDLNHKREVFKYIELMKDTPWQIRLFENMADTHRWCKD